MQRVCFSWSFSTVKKLENEIPGTWLDTVQFSMILKNIKGIPECSCMITKDYAHRRILYKDVWSQGKVSCLSSLEVEKKSRLCVGYYLCVCVFRVWIDDVTGLH